MLTFVIICRFISLLENPETLTIKILLSLTTKWIDNQKVS